VSLVDRFGSRSAIRGAITHNREALLLLKPAQRNNVVRQALIEAMDRFRHTYLRRRIEGESVSKSPFNYVRDLFSPMIHKGDLYRKSFTGKITARKARGSGDMVPMEVHLAVPFGHAVTKEIASVYRRGMLPQEVRAFVSWFSSILHQRLQTDAKAKYVPRTTGRPQLRLTRGQLQRLRNPPRTRRQRRRA
jgi:hypothetical protein